MIQRNISINDWEAEIYFCVTHYEESVLEEALRRIGAPMGVIVRMRQIARDDEFNTGFTYSSPRLRRSVVVIGKTIKPEEFLDTTVHEVRHLADDVANADGISLSGEDVAYIEGDIARSIFDIIGRFVCPCCNKNKTKKYRKVRIV